MKDQFQHITQSLSYALTFIRQAQESQWPELRKQHLDEAERRIESAVDTLKGMNGQAQTK